MGEQVTVSTVRITVSRQTGKVLSEEMIGQREMPAADYGDMLVQILTGMSTEQVYQRLKGEAIKALCRYAPEKNSEAR